MNNDILTYGFKTWQQKDQMKREIEAELETNRRAGRKTK